MSGARGRTIHLGFELGTGKPVAIPLRHLAVTGQTQESGKTTTLEALVARAGVPAIAFVTKRGEGVFQGGRRIPPYFRDRADWQFVDQLISAQLGEKNKWLRQWLIPICRTTRTLADVHRAIKKAMETAKGIREGAYVQLDAYLELIVPEISKARLAEGIRLEPGLNVMDVSGYTTPMQMLFVQSALDWVMVHEGGVVTIVPEAWEFVPEGKGSPAKASAIALIRKGAGLGNYLWVDSQDMAGVDKTILRGCPVWLIGVQREANEIKRNLSNIPAGIRRPSPADVALLDLGEFYACWSDRTVKVYVQPEWMHEDQAIAAARGGRARGERPPVDLEEFVRRGRAAQHAVDREIARAKEEDPKMCEQHQRLERELETWKDKFARSEKEAFRAQREASDAGAKLTVAEGQAAAAADLGRAIARLLPAGAGGGGMEAVDLIRLSDAVVERVLARIPAGGGGPVTVTPPGKLRMDFQREEAERIVAAARDVSPLAKRVLKLIEALGVDVFMGQPTVATRLGRSYSGDARVNLAKAVGELADLGFVEVKERAGVRRALRTKISGDLASYQASDADIEGVYQAVLYEVATEGEAA